jgi:hypothetical protein
MVIQSIDSKSAYHYITRTLYFSKHKSEIEELEYCASYNMPIWSEIILKSFGMQQINIQVRLDEPHHILQSLCQKNWIKIAVLNCLKG